VSGPRLEALRALLDRLAREPLSPRAIETARMGILDCAGCIVGGAATPAAGKVLALAREEGGRGPAAVLGTSVRLPPGLAALANGAAGHVLDYDDMSSVYLGHPSVVLVPAVFAVAAMRGASGRDAIGAYVAGFEVASWLGREMVPAHYDAGWHATSSLGVIGAAASAATLLGLHREGLLAALAIAASSAAGLRANFGSMTKSLHAGLAAEAGVRAALLASRGFTANAAVFDSPGGFFDAYRTNAQPKPAPEGGALEIESSGIGIKPYACCGAGVSVIDAALEIRAAGPLDASAIESVECTVSPMACSIMPYARAADGLQAKYCIAYCAAVALQDGAGGLAQFEDERVKRADVQGLAARVAVRADATKASGAGRFGVTLVVHSRGGATRTAALELPRGHPRRPLDAAALVAKFVECAGPALGEARAREAAARLQRLESLPSLAPAIDLLTTEDEA
jgi:2-methylcitrate dehydratase PrpD